MSAKPNFFSLGLFIAGGIALFVVGILIFGGGQMFRQKIMAETYVTGSAQGIDVGSPLKFRGVPIGKVTAVSFVFTEYGLSSSLGFSNYVVIQMEINREVFPNMFTENLSTRLTQGISHGLRVRIEPQGVTGLNYLDMDYLDPEKFPVLQPEWTPRYYYIPSAPGQITSFLDSINTIMTEVGNLNIGGMSKAGTELIENLNKAVTGAQVEKLSADLQGLITQANTTLDAAKLPELSADARKFLTELESSNKQLKQILTNIEPASRLNAAQIREIVSNLTATTAHLEQLSASVKSKPSLLLWGSPKESPKPSAKPSPTPKRKP